MVCPAAVLTSSLAISLLRHSSPPNQSFVFSPLSLNTALSIVHDGAIEETQEELTHLLLNECIASDVTQFYSSLAHSISSTKNSEVTFNSATRFYVDDSISLKGEYQKIIEEKYKVKVENLNLNNKDNAAQTMNQFVDSTTNGMIKNIFKPDMISDNAVAFLINAIYFHGKWKLPFNPDRTRSRAFKSDDGERNIDFMSRTGEQFRVNFDFGTTLIMPYQDKKYSFFFILPKESSNLEILRNELNGELLLGLLKNAESTKVTIIVPKFKLESKLNGAQLLKKFGVETLFNEEADLSKISSADLYVSKVQHQAVIEMDEYGSEAAAMTYMEISMYSSRQPPEPPTILIDRPFLFGIIRDEVVLFLGQFT